MSERNQQIGVTARPIEPLDYAPVPLRRRNRSVVRAAIEFLLLFPVLIFGVLIGLMSLEFASDENWSRLGRWVMAGMAILSGLVVILLAGIAMVERLLILSNSPRTIEQVLAVVDKRLWGWTGRRRRARAAALQRNSSPAHPPQERHNG